jgi:hypothetical protein
MDYLKHYNSLINRSKNRIIEDYTECHHILPRCMGGTDDPNNLVNLTPEEHYLAHQLLIKIYPENKQLAYAANMMCTNRPNNKLYGWLRRRMSENMKQNNPNKDGLSNKKRKGQYHISEFGRRNMSKAFKGKLNVGEKNGMFGVKPWNHPRSTDNTKRMWKNANIYYEWWINSGLDHGQNAMARHFNEKYCITHANLIKHFRAGWNPLNDEEWKKLHII